MNWVLMALFIVMGAAVIFLGRNDGALTLPAVLFLSMMFLIIPIACFVTAMALGEPVPTWKSTLSMALNAVVALFSVLLLLLLYLSNRLNAGLVAVFVPFIINIVSLATYRADPTGRAI
jgi:phosphatidylglycerophosphate synthase